MNLFLVRMILATAFLAEFPVAMFIQQPDLSGVSVAEARLLTVDPSARDYWPGFSPLLTARPGSQMEIPPRSIS